MPFIISSDKIEYEQDGEVLAEVDYPAVRPGTVDICHTYVDDALRGQGIAAKLMECAVAELRRTDRKAVLSCSYAIRWFEQHPECSDILET